MGIITILAALLLPALSRVRERARMAVCANNLKQISFATQMYSIDNDGRMPWTAFFGYRPVNNAHNLIGFVTLLKPYLSLPYTSQYGGFSFNPAGYDVNPYGYYAFSHQAMEVIIRNSGPFICPSANHTTYGEIPPPAHEWHFWPEEGTSVNWYLSNIPDSSSLSFTYTDVSLMDYAWNFNMSGLRGGLIPPNQFWLVDGRGSTFYSHSAWNGLWGVMYHTWPDDEPLNLPPTRALYAQDGSDAHAQSRHNNGVNVLFLEGHVRWVQKVPEEAVRTDYNAILHGL